PGVVCGRDPISELHRTRHHVTGSVTECAAGDLRAQRANGTSLVSAREGDSLSRAVRATAVPDIHGDDAATGSQERRLRSFAVAFPESRIALGRVHGPVHEQIRAIADFGEGRGNPAPSL